MLLHQLPAQDVLEGLVRPALQVQLLWLPSSFGSLRSPCGFQCFPRWSSSKVPNNRSFRIDPRSCEQASPVIRHQMSVCTSSPALIPVHKSWPTPKCSPNLLRVHLPIFADRGAPHLDQLTLASMAHYRSRIGSLVGWGLPVTLGAPTPLLGSGNIHLLLGAQ